MQVHPDPDIEDSVRPDGTVSVTVTVPLVAPAPAPFDTVTVYVAPDCPTLKFPVCVLVLFSAGETVLVESFVFPEAGPPPDTPSAFTWGDVAVGDTSTATKIGG